MGKYGGDERRDFGSCSASYLFIEVCGHPISFRGTCDLPAMLVPVLRTGMLKLDRGQAAMTLANRVLGS